MPIERWLCYALETDSDAMQEATDNVESASRTDHSYGSHTDYTTSNIGATAHLTESSPDQVPASNFGEPQTFTAASSTPTGDTEDIRKWIRASAFHTPWIKQILTLPADQLLPADYLRDFTGVLGVLGRQSQDKLCTLLHALCEDCTSSDKLELKMVTPTEQLIALVRCAMRDMHRK